LIINNNQKQRKKRGGGGKDCIKNKCDPLPIAQSAPPTYQLQRIKSKEKSMNLTKLISYRQFRGRAVCVERCTYGSEGSSLFL